MINAIALRKAQTPLSFGLSERDRVKQNQLSSSIFNHNETIHISVFLVLEKKHK